MSGYLVIATAVLAFCVLTLALLRLQGRPGTRIPFGVSVLALSLLSYRVSESLSSKVIFGVELSAERVGEVLLTISWLAVAYTVNAAIKRYVYRRKLTPDGDPRVPLIVQYLVSALVYLITTMLIVSLVFEQSVLGLAATSGALALILGYSARTVLEEVFAGIALNFSSPFEKGDLIQLNEEWGAR